MLVCHSHTHIFTKTTDSSIVSKSKVKSAKIWVTKKTYVNVYAPRRTLGQRVRRAQSSDSTFRALPFPKFIYLFIYF